MSFIRGIYSTSVVNEYLDLLDLTKMQNKLAANLSEGSKRKLLVIMSLIGSPDLLLLDKPTQGVDMFG